MSRYGWPILAYASAAMRLVAPRRRRVSSPQSLDVDVVVCVHNALEHVQECLSSLSAALNGRGHVVIVDDGSAEETADWLRRFADDASATLVRHDERQGYTKSANDGVAAGRGGNVVLLNSDTVVPARAIDKLVAALERYEDIGIVGPMSNAASWQSVPSNFGLQEGQTVINPLPEGATPDDLDAFLEARLPARPARVPLVHGFCLAFRRTVYEQLGGLDEAAFPDGYGEENDFCLRAADAGFGLGVAINAYVYHAKSKSYSDDRRAALMRQGAAALEGKHSPQRVVEAVSVMTASLPLRTARFAVRRLYERLALTPRPASRVGSPS